MNKFAFTAALGAAFVLVGCGDGGGNDAAGNGTADGGNGAAAAEGNGSASGGGNASAAASWPRGARIVEENGVTFRVDPDGTRVRLGDSDARIVVENGVRYRVEPGGTRVRIDERGIDVDVDGPDIDLPDVDIGINNKGNPDVDVGDRDPDGGR